MTLALFGGKPAVNGGLLAYNSIGEAEIEFVRQAVEHFALSGFLGGIPWGGPLVQRLEDKWAAKFGVTEAIACNSATSGLLAAASCVDHPQSRNFHVSCYTMSATAAAPRILGMQPSFEDIDPDTYNMVLPGLHRENSPVFVTNLFGRPADLHRIRALCDRNGSLMIEDNAQAPLAKIGGRYAGTVGHIGVFSLNVHKHLQCGEGGVVVTNDRVLAARIRQFINHGEMASSPDCGLNLRMTEYTAAIALSQLNRIDELVGGRIVQAEKILEVLSETIWLKQPPAAEDIRHVYYTLPLNIYSRELGLPRKILVDALRAEGFPLVEGYVNPLYNLPAFAQFAAHCPNAEESYKERLVYFENCAWSPTEEQIGQFGDACRKIEANLTRLRSAA